MIDFLLKIFSDNLDKPAFADKNGVFTYSDLLITIKKYSAQISNYGIPNSAVCAIEAESSGKSISLLLALIKHNSICVPLTNTFESKKEEFIKIAEVEYIFKINEENLEIKHISSKSESKLISSLKEINEPGLILFSSGTSGKSKAVLHRMSKLLMKYKKPRKNFRTIAFMHYDHIGGFDTIFYSLSNGSMIIFPDERTPSAVCNAVEKFKAEVLPVTPTFLNLLLLSEAYKEYDLSSLKYITYGTEVMPEYLLKRYNELFPQIIFLQKYGTTEVGTLRSKSLTPDSPWVKIGGEGYQIRIVDNILQIKAESAMLGYINAESPFTDDGWYITGDTVETEGDYIRILGRQTEIINVGGEKVYPQEVENIVLEIKGVLDVYIYGLPNPLTGNIVCADIAVDDSISDTKLFIKQVKRYCATKLPNFKVPVKIAINSEKQHSERFKKMRNKYDRSN